MPSTLRQLDDEPHAAPIAPDLVPADWADCVPQPANDATSREKLFAEIREAAEAAAPKVDNTFRATDVSEAVVLDSSSRAWIKRAGTGFAIALVGVLGAAVWQHHGDAATETLANLVPGVSASPTAESAEPAAQPAPPVQPLDTTQTAAATASGTTPIPPEAAQQIQSLTRDLAAMTQQVEQLKAQIETMKAGQQAAGAPAPASPVARAPAPKPPAHRIALPPRPIPVAPPPRPAYPPAMQAAATPPPPAASTAPPPAYQPPPYAPPPQATTQPNGEPVIRPPMPMPLSDRY